MAHVYPKNLEQSADMARLLLLLIIIIKSYNKSGNAVETCYFLNIKG